MRAFHAFRWLSFSFLLSGETLWWWWWPPREVHYLSVWVWRGRRCQVGNHCCLCVSWFVWQEWHSVVQTLLSVKLAGCSNSCLGMFLPTAIKLTAGQRGHSVALPGSHSPSWVLCPFFNMHACMHTQRLAHTLTHARAHTHTHTHTHRACTHTHTYWQNCECWKDVHEDWRQSQHSPGAVPGGVFVVTEQQLWLTWGRRTLQQWAFFWLQAAAVHASVPHWVCRPVAGHQQEVPHLSRRYPGQQQRHHDTGLMCHATQ